MWCSKCAEHVAQRASSWSQVLLFNTALLPDPTSTSCMVLKGELFRHDTQPDPQECACWAARDVHHETALPTILGGNGIAARPTRVTR